MYDVNPLMQMAEALGQQEQERIANLGPITPAVAQPQVQPQPVASGNPLERILADINDPRNSEAVLRAASVLTSAPSGTPTMTTISNAMLAGQQAMREQAARQRAEEEKRRKLGLEEQRVAILGQQADAAKTRAEAYSKQVDSEAQGKQELRKLTTQLRKLQINVEQAKLDNMKNGKGDSPRRTMGAVESMARAVASAKFKLTPERYKNEEDAFLQTVKEMNEPKAKTMEQLQREFWAKNYATFLMMDDVEREQTIRIWGDPEKVLKVQSPQTTQPAGVQPTAEQQLLGYAQEAVRKGTHTREQALQILLERGVDERKARAALGLLVE